MSDKPTSRPRLNRTRVFLIVMVAVALTLAVMTIASSLSVWQERDAAAPAAVADRRAKAPLHCCSSCAPRKPAATPPPWHRLRLQVSADGHRPGAAPAS